MHCSFSFRLQLKLQCISEHKADPWDDMEKGPPVTQSCSQPPRQMPVLLIKLKRASAFGLWVNRCFQLQAEKALQDCCIHSVDFPLGSWKPATMHSLSMASGARWRRDCKLCTLHPCRDVCTVSPYASGFSGPAASVLAHAVAAAGLAVNPKHAFPVSLSALR